MTTSWKAILGVILIYIFGFLSGAAVIGIIAHHKVQEFMRHPFVSVSAALEKRLTRNLKLDATQKEKVHQYFVENMEQRKALQQQIQPQVQMLNRQTFQEINSVLRPDQAETFHQNITEFRQHSGQNPLPANGNTPPTLPAPAVTTPPGNPPPH